MVTTKTVSRRIDVTPSDLPHPLPDPLVELIAARFAALAEPTRIRLLDRLREGEASVTELVEATGTSQQNVSKHLRVLADAGIVSRRRDGNFVRYALTDEMVMGICAEVCGSVRRSLDELDALLGGARRVSR
jgi:ArsR family transcriptional regulator